MKINGEDAEKRLLFVTQIPTFAHRRQALQPCKFPLNLPPTSSTNLFTHCVLSTLNTFNSKDGCCSSSRAGGSGYPLFTQDKL